MGPAGLACWFRADAHPSAPRSLSAALRNLPPASRPAGRASGMRTPLTAAGLAVRQDDPSRACFLGRARDGGTRSFHTEGRRHPPGSRLRHKAVDLHGLGDPAQSCGVGWTAVAGCHYYYFRASFYSGHRTIPPHLVYPFQFQRSQLFSHPTGAQFKTLFPRGELGKRGGTVRL